MRGDRCGYARIVVTTGVRLIGGFYLDYGVAVFWFTFGGGGVGTYRGNSRRRCRRSGCGGRGGRSVRLRIDLREEDFKPLEAFLSVPFSDAGLGTCFVSGIYELCTASISTCNESDLSRNEVTK